MTMPDIFLTCPASIPCYRETCARIRAAFPAAALKVDRTQAAFVRGVQFAWLSAPKRKSDQGCVILSFALPERLASPRIFASTEPYRGRFMHHMLLRSPDELDGACLAWLTEAYAFAERRKGK